jgi:hypothetical protein
MLIDCDRCEMRDIACDDCVVTALLGIETEAGSESGTDLADETAVALRHLAAGGLAPPLRLRVPDAASG